MLINILLVYIMQHIKTELISMDPEKTMLIITLITQPNECVFMCCLK